QRQLRIARTEQFAPSACQKARHVKTRSLHRFVQCPVPSSTYPRNALSAKWGPGTILKGRFATIFRPSLIRSVLTCKLYHCSKDWRPPTGRSDLGTLAYGQDPQGQQQGRFAPAHGWLAPHPAKGG